MDVSVLDQSFYTHSSHSEYLQYKVSIGICATNDEKTIGQLLASLTKSKFQPFGPIVIIEIIIILSGCTDNSERIIKKFTCEYPNKVILINEPERSGKATAINILLKMFKGDALVLLPADVYTAEKSIELITTKLIKEQDIAIVSGHPIINHLTHKCTTICRTATCLWNLHNHSFELLGQERNTHATGELMILRRGIIEKIPVNIINDDAYIALIASFLGWKIGYEKRALVRISIPNRLSDFLAQRKRIIKGHKQLAKLKHAQTTTTKNIFRKNPLLSMKIIINELKRFENWSYFAFLVVLEIYIELVLFFQDPFTKKIEYIWKRAKLDRLP